jgi:hypothetical protein
MALVGTDVSEERIASMIRVTSQKTAFFLILSQITDDAGNVFAVVGTALKCSTDYSQFLLNFRIKIVTVKSAYILRSVRNL